MLYTLISEHIMPFGRLLMCSYEYQRHPNNLQRPYNLTIKTQNWPGPKARAFATFSFIIKDIFWPSFMTPGRVVQFLGWCQSQPSLFSYISPYYSQKHKNGHNFAKNGPNDSIFSQKFNIHKINISWKFGENPTWWRHFMTSYVIFL